MNMIYFFAHQFFPSLDVSFDSIVSSGVEVNSVAFDQFWNVLVSYYTTT